MNSREEELLGLEELKESNIDFRKYTLLLGYFKLPGLVLGYRYQYARELATDQLMFLWVSGWTRKQIKTLKLIIFSLILEVQSWFQKYLKMKMWFFDGLTDAF